MGRIKVFCGNTREKELKVQEKTDIMWELIFYHYKRRVSFGFY